MILITGAAGVIGRAVAARLKRDRLPCVALRRADLDLANPQTPLHAVLEARPSCIVHLAAAVPRPTEMPDDEGLADRTRQIDRNVLEAVRHWDCDAIYVSGCSLYDKAGTGARTEQDADIAAAQNSPYLAAKQEGERLFLASGRATVLRVSAPLGGGLPAAAVAMRFILAAQAGLPISLWGSGSREQNYVDTEDIADAVVRALIARPRALINIAAAEPVTMRELAAEVVRVAGRGSVRLSGQPDPKEGEAARYAIERAELLLGWKPTTPLRESLARLCGVEA